MAQPASALFRGIVTLISFFLGCFLPIAADAVSPESYGKLPLHFEANQGQTHKDVRFLSRGPGYSLYLTAGEAVLVLTQPNADSGREQAKPAELRMGLVGAARKPVVSGIKELPGKANYFIGNDPAKWRTNVPTYGRVHYREVYPGIDLVYYGNQRSLEYDFVVAPGADPKKIVLGFKGADKLEIDAQGDLVLHTPGGVIRQHKPVIYQDVDGVRQEVAGSYVRKGANRVGFELAAYDRTRPLVIDPVLAYSTYLGGSVNDVSSAIAIDTSGNAYVTGHTNSMNFPTTPGAFQPTLRRSFEDDIFVAKLDPTGSTLVYSTYLGGSYPDMAFAIAVDNAGNAYVTGYASFDFPTTEGAFQRTFGGARLTPHEAFVAKLDPQGSALVYSTFLGGPNFEYGTGIAVDGGGNAYVTGAAESGFPTTAGAFQTAGPPPVEGISKAFVTKVNPLGTGLVYSTYLGGAGTGNTIARGGAIAVDSSGNAYVTGETTSTDFPTTEVAFQRTLGGGADAFVTKLNPAGSALVYSSYLGGNGPEFGHAIAVDAQGNAYVTGQAQSSNFPTTSGAFQPNSGGAGDAFVTKVNPSGSALVYSTHLGGRRRDSGSGIAVDAVGNAYVIGSTGGMFDECCNDFPTTPGAFQTSPGRVSVFVTKLDPTGSSLLYSSYLGGTSLDSGAGIAVDASGNAYLTGLTNGNFPTTEGAFQRTRPGGTDSFITKLAIPTLGSDAALLVIDKNGIDDGKAPTFFSQGQVNNDVAGIGVRAQLRFFRDHVGQTVVLPSGKIEQEGWLALRTIPPSWAQAGGAVGFVGNPAANPGDPAPHGTGPGLGAPNANGDTQSLLRGVPNVTPLRETALTNLVGREVCAVAYDAQINYRIGDLRGKTLGTVAFQVVAVTPSNDPSLLPNVEVRILDAKSVCRGPFALLTNAEITGAAPSQ
jgi:hypothetical protein